jgi:NAD+ synthase (glutamine-hydrolysing)
MPEGIAAVVGLLTKNPSKRGRPYFNSAALLIKGKKPRFFHKTLLPTGDVFDEARFIEPGDMSKNFFSLKGRKFFVTICEDIWAWPDANDCSPYKENPLLGIDAKGVDLVINLSASPWHLGKMKKREYVTRRTAARFKAPLLYVNLVGAQDEMIFDGRSFLMDPKGKRRLECLAFEEDLNIFDINTLETWTPTAPTEEIEELHKGLVLGLRDFCVKTGLNKVHLGLRSGIDSALVSCLAVDALGPSNVVCFALPGPYSSPESFTLAEQLAKNLKVSFQALEIGGLYDAAQTLIEEKWNLSGLSVTQENLQSRLRGLLLMAYSNSHGSLLLTTGNKSEYATGYATLYGDMCGGLAPIGDLTKAQVYALSKHYNSQTELIPERILTRPPTAELRPNQKDQDSLPPYDELDEAVIRLVEKGERAKSKTQKWVMSQILKTEFKRWQAAPILKASAHSFGRGRRFPISHRASED